MKYLIMLLLTLCGSVFAQDSIEKAQEGYTEALSAAQLKYNGSKAQYDEKLKEVLEKYQKEYMSAGDFDSAVYVDNLLKGKHGKGKQPKNVAFIVKRHGYYLNRVKSILERDKLDANKMTEARLEKLKISFVKLGDLNEAKKVHDYLAKFKENKVINPVPVRVPREVVVKNGITKEQAVGKWAFSKYNIFINENGTLKCAWKGADDKSRWTGTWKIVDDKIKIRWKDGRTPYIQIKSGKDIWISKNGTQDKSFLGKVKKMVSVTKDMVLGKYYLANGTPPTFHENNMMTFKHGNKTISVPWKIINNRVVIYLPKHNYLIFLDGKPKWITENGENREIIKIEKK